MMESRPPRFGGHVVADSLERLGADTVFGVPGVHALGISEGARLREQAAVVAA